MNTKKIIGLTLATAAAAAFMAAPITSTAHAAKNVPCYGINGCKGKNSCKGAHNSCKGKNSCKGAHNACKGQNSCKGHGVTMVKSKKACFKAGGKLAE